MRFWDGREVYLRELHDRLELHRSFANLVFDFEDVYRMQDDDVRAAVEWVDDRTLVHALYGASRELREKVGDCLDDERVRRIARMMAELSSVFPEQQEESRRSIVDLIRRL